MKLAKVEITNFRCFESLSINLQKDVNVIVGVNGAGKTAILDAIAIGLWDIVAANGGGGDRQRKLQGVSLRSSDMHIPAEVEKKIRDFVQIRSMATDVYPVTGSVVKFFGDKEYSLEWQNDFVYQTPRGFSYESSKSNRLSEIYEYFQLLWNEIGTSDTKALIPLPVVAYYRSNRRISEMPNLGEIFSVELDRKGAYRQALNAGTDYQAMCQWLYLRENKELREKFQVRNDSAYELPDLKAARLAINKVIKNVDQFFFDDTTFKVMLKDQQKTKVLELEQMSDGYRNLLAMVLDFARRLAQANPGWDNPLEAPGIMLIDEIELHLHPGWQQTIVTCLKAAFPNTQLILTTHSPEVVTTVESMGIQILADYTLRPCPAPTFGAKSSDVVSEVLGVSTLRPPDNPIAEKISALFSAIDEGRLDDARKLRDNLEEWAKGFPEPDLTKAGILIRRLESIQARENNK